MAEWRGGGVWGMDGSGPVPGSPDLSFLSAAPRGKRGWKSFHGILKGMILYLQKVWGQARGLGLGLSWLVGDGWVGIGGAGPGCFWGQDKMGTPAGGVQAWEGPFRDGAQECHQHPPCPGHSCQ